MAICGTHINLQMEHEGVAIFCILFSGDDSVDESSGAKRLPVLFATPPLHKSLNLTGLSGGISSVGRFRLSVGCMRRKSTEDVSN